MILFSNFFSTNSQFESSTQSNVCLSLIAKLCFKFIKKKIFKRFKKIKRQNYCLILGQFLMLKFNPEEKENPPLTLFK